MSQLSLLLKGHGSYDHIFNCKFAMVTAHANYSLLDIDQDFNHNNALCLTVKDTFTIFEDIHRHIVGRRLTTESFIVPSNSKPFDRVTGRTVINLEKLALKNIEKTAVVAKE